MSLICVVKSLGGNQETSDPDCLIIQSGMTRKCNERSCKRNFVAADRVLESDAAVCDLSALVKEYKLHLKLFLATNPCLFFAPFRGVLHQAAKRRLMLWLRQMPARQARFALGYPCHQQRLKSAPKRSPCLLLSHRWGMRQTAFRHAKSVARGPDSLPRLQRPSVHSHLNT